MIQQEYKNNVADISGEVTTTGFTIEANASVYAMLTQNVYNDPILAVMREWSTNACDACLAAGVPVEYDVHLPTPGEPQFYVRDYGTGLPADDIVGLFSNLGASTKRGSNLYNGTLGIGRMAGLAVADGFTVESYHEGTCYSYFISLQNGIPVTMHLGDAPTTERNGLKLGVEIESHSFSYYPEKANELYKYFDYKPNINDESVIMDLDVEEMISENWYIKKKVHTYDHNYNNYVVMGQVVYTIPSNSAINTHNFHRLVIKAPTGAVTFNPGRESLSLDKKTIEYVNGAFKKVKDEYVSAATTAMAACETDLELINCYYSLISDAPGPIAKAITPDIFMSPELQQLVAKGTYGNNYHITDSKDFQTATFGEIQLQSKHSYYKTASAISHRSQVSLLDFFKSKHVVVDMKTKYKKALNNHYSSTAVVFWQRTAGSDIESVVKTSKNYLTKMGITYKLASDIIAENPVAAATTLPREGLYVSLIARNGHIPKAQSMSSEHMKEGTYLYLPLKHTTPILQDATIPLLEYLLVYTFLQKLDPVTPSIYGVPKKYQEYVDDLDNWLDFESYIKDKVKQLSFRYSEPEGSFRSINSHVGVENVDKFPKLIQEYYAGLNEYRKFETADNYIKSPRLKELLTTFGGACELFKPTKKVTYADIETRLPLTAKEIFSNFYNSHFSSKELILLAKIEEFYALHSTE